MIIWERFASGNHYQLRTAGQSIRLYRNQVFHSQYNGARLLNGGVWDMLWLPLFFRPPQSIKKVLVLGVGAGAAIKKLSEHVDANEIIGIDIDKVHIGVAKKFVGLNTKQAPEVSLHHADAIEWLADYNRANKKQSNKAGFDLIIDDLFYEQKGEPMRAVSFALNKQSWLRELKRALAPSGILVANCVSRTEGRSLVSGHKQSLPGSFEYAYQLRRPNFDNSFCVASRHALTINEWRENLQNALGKSSVKQAVDAISFKQLA